MNSNLNESPDPHDASKCDLCGQRKEGVRAHTLITVGLQSGTVRTKFCDECAANVEKWNDFAQTIEEPKSYAPRDRLRFGEKTLLTRLDRPLTPAEGEHVTRHLVEDAAERELPNLLEKYRAIEQRSGRRIQVCITYYDETTYNFLHLGAERTHDFWRMVNQATARRLREEGFVVRFVSLDLDDYMEWLARENLHDCSTAREQFAAAVADWEMGITPTAPARGLESKARHL